VTKGIRSRWPEQPDEQVREVLRARSERLRAPVAAVVEDAVEWVAEFPVGDERYAIPLVALRAAVPLRRVTAVPLSKPHVVGILRFGGRMLTALSLASLLGIKGWSEDPAVLLVVDAGGGRLVALDCEVIPRPVALPLPVVEEARTQGARAITDVVHDRRVVHLIELSLLLGHDGAVRDGA
jgi:purine-binding chemotaxis protein CheW